MARKPSLVPAPVLPLFTCMITFALALDLDTSSATAVSQTASTIASGLFNTYYNASATTGDFNQPEPWFWWRSGAGWTGMLDYTVYTNDTTYQQALLTALAENVGSEYDFAPAEQEGWSANDDQMYWVYSALTALEYGFDAIEPCVGEGTGAYGTCANSWLSIAVNAFETWVTRWNTDAATCNGGLKWQHRTTAGGYYYKNSVTNGGFFQSAARLARYTGNATFAEWADKIFDWSTSTGLVRTTFNVYDGASDEGTDNCTVINDDQWSYNVATYMHGAANMFTYTRDRGISERQVLWLQRVRGFLGAANLTFFSPPAGNATGVMYEQNCELDSSCSTDQTTFKSSLARWMGKTAMLVPSEAEPIYGLLATSAKAAAASCSDTGDVTCGMKWWTADGFDGLTDFGSQLSALEMVQSLLVTNAPGYATLAS